VYDADGKLVREWGKSGMEDGELNWPGGIAISGAGRVYVADQTNRRVQVFDREGKFLRKWGEYGVQPGQFGGNTSAKSRVGGPQFIAIDAAGNVFTTEASVGRVQKFTADGEFLAAWGDNEDKPGSFGRKFQETSLVGPIGICFDRGGRLWVSTAGGRIQQFSDSGKYLRGFGEKAGSGPGEFLAPHGIAIDSHDRMFVVDGYNHRVQVMDVSE
jgi:sugar lactone lactonase YvrE